MSKTLILTILILSGCYREPEIQAKYNSGDVVRLKTNTNIVGTVLNRGRCINGKDVQYIVRFSVPIVNDWNHGVRMFSLQEMLEFEIEKL